MDFFHKTADKEIISPLGVGADLLSTTTVTQFSTVPVQLQLKHNYVFWQKERASINIRYCFVNDNLSQREKKLEVTDF